MKKYLVILAHMFLMNVAVAETFLLTARDMTKKPNFSNVSIDQHCYDIDMPYFNDCQALAFNIQPVLQVDEKGRVTALSVASTGNRSLDSQIRLALRETQFSPVAHDGVVTQRTASFTINVRMSAPDKEPINAENATLLRQICANDNKCDQNQLESELAKRNL